MLEGFYAGCIPVLVGHETEHPFYDILDWGKFSVQIEPGDLPNLEEILLSRYTIEEVERMQANLMLVRSAFMYPLDGVSDDDLRDQMIDKRGPLFFALHSTGMRLAQQYPTNDIYDRP